MKTTTPKLVAGLVFLTIGFALMSLGVAWLFWLGLAVIVLSRLFLFRPHDTLLDWLDWVLSAAFPLFFIWYLFDLLGKPSATILVIAWVAIAYGEFLCWRAARTREAPSTSL